MDQFVTIIAKGNQVVFRLVAWDRMLEQGILLLTRYSGAFR
jgi:hypothetical protein